MKVTKKTGRTPVKIDDVGLAYITHVNVAPEPHDPAGFPGYHYWQVNGDNIDIVINESDAWYLNITGRIFSMEVDADGWPRCGHTFKTLVYGAWLAAGEPTCPGD